jgi:hypothetical protein
LPPHSHYQAALAENEGFARLALAQRPTADTDPVIPLAGYDAVVARLDNLYDAINAVNETLIAVHSEQNTMRQPNRAPRPETAYQRLAQEHTRQKLDSIADRMLTRGS